MAPIEAKSDCSPLSVGMFRTWPSGVQLSVRSWSKSCFVAPGSEPGTIATASFTAASAFFGFMNQTNDCSSALLNATARSLCVASHDFIAKPLSS